MSINYTAAPRTGNGSVSTVLRQAAVITSLNIINKWTLTKYEIFPWR
jgi:hypothetical protein